MEPHKTLSSALDYVGSSITPDDQLVEKAAGLLEPPAAHTSARRRAASLILLMTVPLVFLSYFTFHAAAAETANSCFLNPYQANTGSIWSGFGTPGLLVVVGLNAIHYLASIALSLCGLLWAYTWVFAMFTAFDKPEFRRVYSRYLKRSAIVGGASLLLMPITATVSCVGA